MLLKDLLIGLERALYLTVDQLSAFAAGDDDDDGWDPLASQDRLASAPRR